MCGWLEDKRMKTLVFSQKIVICQAFHNPAAAVPSNLQVPDIGWAQLRFSCKSTSISEIILEIEIFLCKPNKIQLMKWDQTTRPVEKSLLCTGTGMGWGANLYLMDQY